MRAPASPLIYASAAGVRTRTLDNVAAEGVRAATALWELGLRPGDAVVAQVPNWPEGAALFYASCLLGLRIVPVIHIYGSSELNEIVRQTGATAYVVPTEWRGIDFAERAASVGSSPSLRHVVAIGEPTPFADVSWDRMVRDRRPDDLVLPSLRADDVCLVSFTSGTTSRPKGAQHTNRSLLAEIAQTISAFTNRPSAAFLAAQPAGHVAGLLGFLRAVLIGASPSVFLDAWDATVAFELIDRYHLDSTTGPPYYLTTLLRQLEGRPRWPGWIRDWMTGGERVPPNLIEEADAAGITAYRCYGSTEHPTVSSSRPTDPLRNRARTDGTLLRGVQMRVVDDEDRPLPTGADGELLTSGPDLFRGYLDPADAAGSFTDDGYYRTGDIGHIDTNGVVTITDRKKDIIIRGGENISSREVEEILLRHPAVRDVAVVAAPDPLYGERACAFVVLSPGQHLTLPAVRDLFSQAGVARQKTPERLEVVDDLPRTLVGKIRKADLRAQLAQRSTAPEGSGLIDR